MRVRTILLVIAVVSISAGCDTSVDPPEIPGGIIPDEVEQVAGTLPAPQAASVLSFLEDENFRETWELFPGTEPQIGGGEPHGALLTTYVNQTAHDAIESGTAPLSYDSILVKDNFSSEGDLVATTLMFRSEGFAPEAGDWFWMKWEPDGTVEVSGAVDSCQNCHSMAPGGGYVLTGAATN